MNETSARLLLNVASLPGNELLGQLVAARGAVATVEQLVDNQIPEFKNLKFIERLRAALDGASLSELVDRANSAGLDFLTPAHEAWPTRLNDLDDSAPIGLWVKGHGRLADLTQNSVAIVGARACSPYGERLASDLASHLTANELTVVSGAAYGIDAFAHQGALAVPGPTIAVLACGADQNYPAAHQNLLTRIAQSGLVVSEAPPGTPAAKHLFLIRNRLIAALTGATVVIEAALRSGSLSTSMWAHSLGRQVWGTPGSVTSPASAGVHAAIRDGVMDILLEPGEVIKHFSNKP